MKYFTIKELTSSPTAARKGINNEPSKAVVAALNALVDNVLDPLREAWGAPVIVTSGYRCARLNKVVGGAKNSAHTYGQAADIKTVADTFAENKRLFDLIRKAKIPFDKMIWEHGNDIGPDWIHISFQPGPRGIILRGPFCDARGNTYYTRLN